MGRNDWKTYIRSKLKAQFCVRSERTIFFFRFQVADLAIADLTMTSERILGIDFSPSIMNLGIAILYRRPKREPPHMFSFMAYRVVQVLVTLSFNFHRTSRV